MPKREIEAIAPLTRREFVVTSLAAGFAAPVLPVSAQTVVTTDSQGLVAGEVKIPAAGGEMPAYRAMPATGSAFPMVLVVHEIFGVHEYIKDVCRRLAKLGYCAAAPDLFARHGDVSKMQDFDEIRTKVVSRVSDAQVMGDLEPTGAWATQSSASVSRWPASAGFWGGGWFVGLKAAKRAGLRAGVAWDERMTGPTTELQPKYP